MSVFEAAARPEVLNGGRSPATRLKKKKDDVEAEVEQMSVDLNARSARVAELEGLFSKLELEAQFSKLELQLEQSTSQMRVVKSYYSLHCDMTETLKQRFATVVS